MRTCPPPIVPLFRSELQARLLALLFLGDRGSYTVTQMKERLEVPRSSLQRELSHLIDAGIIERSTVGRTSLYQKAHDSPLHDPLFDLLKKTLGVEVQLRNALSMIDGIEAAAVYGSWAAGTKIRSDSDIDVLIIGTPERNRVYQATRNIEQAVNREINPSIYDRADWSRRVDEGSGFALTLLSRPMNVLLGEIPGRSN